MDKMLGRSKYLMDSGVNGLGKGYINDRHICKVLNIWLAGFYKRIYLYNSAAVSIRCQYSRLLAFCRHL